MDAKSLDSKAGETWFLVADGRRARVLARHSHDALRDLERLADAQGAAGSKSSQTVSNGRLEQHAALEISDDELYDIQDRPPRAFDRVGAGRHGMEKRDLHEAEEEKFLQRVADHVTEAAKRGAFAHLVIAAPPRALGILRNVLPADVKARIKAETAKDLVDEPTDRLHARLEEALRS